MGELRGHQLKPREISEAARVQWPGEERPKGVATSLSECQGFAGALNDNPLNDPPTRDCGIMQISIPITSVDEEAKLRTESLDPAIYLPVVAYGMKRARALYDTPMTRKGKADKRRWQPWVGYTSGWALFPEWWVWHHEKDANGDSVPVGPWNPTGHYIQNAILGCANDYLVIAKTKTEVEALTYAQRQQARFHVEGELGIRGGRIAWVARPAKPTEPPLDGHGPRPIENDGR